MIGQGLRFFPLYYIFHDQWIFRTYTYSSGWQSNPYKHRGHVHFFMLGHDPTSSSGGQAYKGVQNYRFKLEDTWSERVKEFDSNIPDNMKIIGTPKWFFYIREFWRRIYIQPWDSSENNDDQISVIGKTGIKYDASREMHTHGPYRETKDNFFYWVNLGRTLPIEYWQDDIEMIRDHALRAANDPSGVSTWNWSPDAFPPNCEWTIPRKYAAGREDYHYESSDGPVEDNIARRYGYADKYYIYPTIEYQTVIHSDWERWQYHEDRDVDDEDFGDGFEVNVQIPYRDLYSSVIQSPFSDDDGNVGSPGNYYHEFLTKNPSGELRYNTVDPSGEFYDDSEMSGGGGDIPYLNDPASANCYSTTDEWDLPTGLHGQPVSFNIAAGLSEDGNWVEQCLGAEVLGKALVILEDNFGGRHEVWVTDAQFVVEDNFEGSDQNAPGV